MREGYKIAIPILLCVGFVLLISWGVLYGISEDHNRKDHNVLGEGVITNLEIQNSGGISSFKIYIVEIDGKDYETTSNYYYTLEIGDNVIIYESKRVEIL